MASTTIRPKVTVQETVSVTEKTSAEIRATAEEFGVSVSEVIRLAIKYGLKAARTELSRAQD